MAFREMFVLWKGSCGGGVAASRVKKNLEVGIEANLALQKVRDFQQGL
jgi:hypothetical protein